MPDTRPPIFDGNMSVFSECRDCKQLLQITDTDNTSHPNCDPKMTRTESLARGWLSAVLAGDTAAECATYQELAQQPPPDLRSSALRYAGYGWPVFPLRPYGCKCDGGERCQSLCECPKKPATRNGFKDATTDTARIERWWASHPASNIGLATGHLFDVFDIDPRHDGVASFLELLHQNRIPDAHGIVVTARGGMHIYLQPKGVGNKANFKPGCDYRGNGGYCVGPPSVLAPHMNWSWMTAPSPKIKETQ